MEDRQILNQIEKLLAEEDRLHADPDLKKSEVDRIHKIKVELESFGMSEQTLFPELDYQTKSIVQRFSGRYKRKAKSTRRTSAK